MSGGIHRPGKGLNAALLLLAPTIAIVVTTEFIVVGLLSLISRDFGIPLAKAGELAGVFAFSAAVVGPIITLATSKYSPRSILISTLLLFAVCNAVTSTARDFNLVLWMRFVQGAALPTFIGAGGAIVTRLASPSHLGKALAHANIGFVLGLILALPAGAAFTLGGDWRAPFLILSFVPVLMAAIIAAGFPKVPVGPAVTFAGQLELLRRPTFLTHLGLSVLLFAAMFSAYTYLGVWLEQALKLPLWGTTFALFLFGLFGVAGNIIASRGADKALLKWSVIAILVLVAALNLAAATHSVMLLATFSLILWSVSHAASVTLSQVRVTLAGRDAPAFAMTLNISAANLGIAVGSISGGWGIDWLGHRAIGLAATVFAFVALGLLMQFARNQPLHKGAGK